MTVREIPNTSEESLFPWRNEFKFVPFYFCVVNRINCNFVKRVRGYRMELKNKLEKMEKEG